MTEAVEGGTALNPDPLVGDVGEADGVVGTGEDRLGQLGADFFRVDVEGGHELDVAHVVVADAGVHEPGNLIRVRGVAVVLDALHEAGGTVAHPNDGDADGLGHERSPFLLSCPDDLSAAMRSSSQRISDSVESSPWRMSDKV